MYFERNLIIKLSIFGVIYFELKQCDINLSFVIARCVYSQHYFQSVVVSKLLQAAGSIAVTFTLYPLFPPLKNAGKCKCLYGSPNVVE